jgi:hypothetical protein
MVVPPEREEDEMNPTIRKISKKWEDQPCQQEESSSQPCNQEASSFPALSYHDFSNQVILPGGRQMGSQVYQIVDTYFSFGKRESPYRISG